MSLPWGVFFTGGRRGVRSSSVSSSSRTSSIFGTLRGWGAVVTAGAGTGRGIVFDSCAAGSVRERPSCVPHPGQKFAFPGSFFPQLWQNCGLSAGSSGHYRSAHRLVSLQGRLPASSVPEWAGGRVRRLCFLPARPGSAAPAAQDYSLPFASPRGLPAS